MWGALFEEKWVRRLKLLLALATAFSSSSPEGLITILFFLTFETPSVREWQVAVFITYSNNVAQFNSLALGFLFDASQD
jgi:hypothetical protein